MATSFGSLALIALISTALWALGSRTRITSAIWTRYPPRVADFMDCPACVGFWHGMILTIVAGYQYKWQIFEIPMYSVPAPIIVGLCMLVLTTLLAGLWQHALFVAGSAIIHTDPNGKSYEDGYVARESTSHHPV